MMNRLPALFVSHGAPTLALEPGTTGAALHSVALALPRPREILMVSAHWDTALPRVSAAARQDLIYDFSGFPGELYRIAYPAPGAPQLASRVEALLNDAGMAAELDERRGLDHGAWVPLLFMFPDATVPVTQLSLQSRRGPAYHHRVGRALSALRAEGVLIVGSGSLTHNLHEVGRYAVDAPPEPYVREFREWMSEELAAGRLENLFDYRKRAPQGARAHPTEEHLLPLFVAMGAAGMPLRTRHVHDATTYGVLAMDIFAFGTDNSGTAADSSAAPGASNHA